MKPINNASPVYSIAPASGSGAATPSAVDTRGYNYVFYEYYLSSGTTASVMKITECDTSGGSYTDVTGHVGGTDYTIPDATSAAKTVIGGFPTPGRKRYIKMALTNASAVVRYAECLLCNKSGPPLDATGLGVAVACFTA